MTASVSAHYRGVAPIFSGSAAIKAPLPDAHPSTSDAPTPNIVEALHPAPGSRLVRAGSLDSIATSPFSVSRHEAAQEFDHQLLADRVRQRVFSRAGSLAQQPPVTGSKETCLDSFHLKRGMYLLRYTDATGLQRGVVPLGPNSHTSGAEYLGGEQIGSSAAGFLADGAFSVLLAPLGGVFAFRAAKDALRDFKTSKKLQAEERALTKRGAHAAARARLDGGTPSTSDKADAVLFSHRRRTLRKRRQLLLNNALEAASSAIDRGAVVGNLVTSMAAKMHTLSACKGLGSLASEAGSAGVSIAGAVCALGLAPIASLFQLAESLFLVRRANKMKKTFMTTAPEALEHVRRHATGEGLDDYRAFFERKHKVRQKFYRGFSRWSRFRLGAASLIGAAGVTKFGIAVAALVAGGIAFSNPVGWAITAAVVVIAIVATLGASTFIFDRRRSAYEHQRHSNDPLIDREFMHNLEAMEVLTAPLSSSRARVASGALSSSTPTLAPARLVLHRMPPRARRAEAANDDAFAPLLRGLPCEETSDSGSCQLDLFSIPDDRSEDDDLDNEASSPISINAGPALAYRAALHKAFKKQAHACAQFNHRLRVTHKKSGVGALRRVLTNLQGYLCALGHGGWISLSRASIVEGRTRFRTLWMKHAAQLTLGHYQHEIRQCSPAWRTFMAHHLVAEKQRLQEKQRLSALISADRLTQTPDLSRRLAEDDLRLEKVTDLLGILADGQRAPSAPSDINRRFLRLMSLPACEHPVGEEDIIESLAVLMHKHYRRHNRDLQGMVFACELEAVSLRQAAERIA